MKKLFYTMALFSATMLASCSSSDKETDQKMQEDSISISSETDSLLKAAEEANMQTTATVDSLQSGDSTQHAH